MSDNERATAPWVIVVISVLLYAIHLLDDRIDQLDHRLDVLVGVVDAGANQ